MKKIVRGNDFSMRIPVMKIVDGERVAFPLPACTDLAVNVVSLTKRIPLECSIAAEQDNVLIAKVDSTKVKNGTYALEVKGKIFGNHWRSNEYEQFKIVENNASADTEFDNEVIEGEDSVEMDTAIVFLPPTTELTQLIKDTESLNDKMQSLNQELNKSEAQREEAETGRVTAETAREKAEEDRKTAEGQRAVVETQREDNERERMAEEVAREKAEDARVAVEAEHVKAEQARIESESERVISESARSDAETARSKAESERATAELSRVSAESARVEAEKARAADMKAAKEATEAAVKSTQEATETAYYAADKAMAATKDLDEAMSGAQKINVSVEGDPAEAISVTNRAGEVSYINIAELLFMMLPNSLSMVIYPNNSSVDALINGEKVRLNYPIHAVQNVIAFSTRGLYSNIKKIETYQTKCQFDSLADLCFAYIDAPYIDVEKFNVSRIADMSQMFYNCKNIHSLAVSAWDTENATNMAYMFSDCPKLKDIDISLWDTSNVTDMSFMFAYDESLEEVDLSSLNLTKVTDMSFMFDNCTSLKSVKFLKENLFPDLLRSSLKDVRSMFSNCRNLSELTIAFSDSPVVEDCSYMLSSCTNLKKFSTEVIGYDWYFSAYFDTGKVKNMQGMFSECYNLEEIHLCEQFGKMPASVGTVDFSDCSKWTGDTVKTLLNLYDRTKNGLGAITFKLHANTKAALGEDGIAQLTAKGYTIA